MPVSWQPATAAPAKANSGGDFTVACPPSCNCRRRRTKRPLCRAYDPSSPPCGSAHGDGSSRWSRPPIVRRITTLSLSTHTRRKDAPSSLHYAGDPRHGRGFREMPVKNGQSTGRVQARHRLGQRMRPRPAPTLTRNASKADPRLRKEGSGGADQVLALRTELLDAQLDDVTFTQVRRRIHGHAHSRWRTGVDEVARLQDHELAEVVH